jgi:hypothetical protein
MTVANGFGLIQIHDELAALEEQARIRLCTAQDTLKHFGASDACASDNALLHIPKADVSHPDIEQLLSNARSTKRLQQV